MGKHFINISQPETTAAAEAIYRESQHPIYLSGGQEVVLRLQHELEHISDLIDLSNIDELHGVHAEGPPCQLVRAKPTLQ